MKVALFFGSFNPVHIGHLAIANYIVEFSEISQLWFVLSPQNPLKNKSTLLPDYQRLEILNRSIENYPKFQVSTIEFNLPKPSYTIDTLIYLKEKHPDNEFYLVMGADNIATINKWKNFEKLLCDFNIIVYPRPGIEHNDFFEHKNVQLIDAPLMEISSSFIRTAIKDGKDIRYFIPQKAYEYIDDMNFYR
jgi:nicotinate-nucleotide adenylyltransferase